jgi:hypothetical protein
MKLRMRRSKVSRKIRKLQLEKIKFKNSFKWKFQRWVKESLFVENVELSQEWKDFFNEADRLEKQSEENK